MSSSTRFYDDNAQRLCEAYEHVDPELIHSSWRDFLPNTCGHILDLGCGSGRDAVWLSKLGHEVVAMDGSNKMLDQAKTRHSEPGIRWLNDSLPDLREIERLHQKFDLILLSGVWMHVAPDQRSRVFRKLVNLLKPAGSLVFSLRMFPLISLLAHQTVGMALRDRLSLLLVIPPMMTP